MSASDQGPLRRSQIPALTHIYEALGFEQRERKILQYNTHQWRRLVKFSDGTTGQVLRDWTSAEVQKRLRRLAKEFVRSDFNSRRFWPPRKYPGSAEGPEWPKDKERILSLLQQLFYQQNINDRKKRPRVRRPATIHLNVLPSGGGDAASYQPFSPPMSPARSSYGHSTRRDHASFPTISLSTTQPSSGLVSPIDQAQGNGHVQAGTKDLNTNGPSMSRTVAADRSANGTMKDSMLEVIEIDSNNDDLSDNLIEMYRPRPRVRKSYFNKPSSIESTQEESREYVEKPKKAKRSRRLAKRLESEDHESSMPSPTKRKRDTSPRSALSPASVTSASFGPSSSDYPPSKPQTQVKTVPRFSEVTPLGNNRFPQEGSLNRRPYSRDSDSENLGPHLEKSRRPLDMSSFGTAPRSFVDASRDTLASASQNHRTVDPLQQHPTTSEKRHVAAQTAVISRYLNCDECPGQPGMESTNSRRPLSNSEGHPPEAAGYHVTGLAEGMEHSPAELFGQRPQPLHSTRGGQQVQEDHHPRHHSEKEHSRRESDLFAVSAPVLTLPDQSTEATAQSATLLTLPDQSTRATAQSATLPTLPDQSTTATAQSEKPHDGNTTTQAPALPATRTTTQSSTPTTISSPALKPALQIRYWIITSRHPEYNRIKWRTGSLLGKSLKSLCAEIATVINRPIYQSIIVNLKTSEGNLRSELECDKPETLEELQEEFAEEIKRDKRRGNLRFEITLEPDPVREAMVVKVPGDGEADGDSDIAF